MTHRPEQPDAQIIQGHVLDKLAEMDAESVSCCVTSSPYWSLRKYDAPDIVWGGDAECRHAWTKEATKRQTPISETSTLAIEKGGSLPTVGFESDISTCSLCGAWRGQYGLEPTPELYVEHTLDVMRAIRRVLRPDGVVWWNIGDGYAASPSGNQKWTGWETGGIKDASGNYEKRSTVGGALKPKDLVLMPSRVALAAQADGWWVRSMIVWSKPNAMPESTKDRPTTAHEYVLMLTKSARYWYDQEAVREPAMGQNHHDLTGPGYDAPGQTKQLGNRKQDGHGRRHAGFNARWAEAEAMGAVPAGRNMRSVWEFPTAQTPEAHFATFPEELPRRCILASAPQAICSKCGVARVRIVEAGETQTIPRYPSRERIRDSKMYGPVSWKTANSVGWTVCKCKSPSYVPGLVLDPFAGIGTTGTVARRLGRRFVGIELSEAYCRMAAKRMEQTTLGIPL